jgi:hypothetical protein
MSEHETAKPQAGDQHKGNVTLRGTLRRTKGGRLVIDGVLVSLSRADREKLVTEFGNAEVLVTGDLFRHTCEREEQCPEEGYIDYLSNLSVKRAD